MFTRVALTADKKCREVGVVGNGFMFGIQSGLSHCIEASANEEADRVVTADYTVRGIRFNLIIIRRENEIAYKSLVFSQAGTGGFL